MVLKRFQKVANVCVIHPEHIKDKEVLLAVVEVDLVDVGIGRELEEVVGQSVGFPSIKVDGLMEEQQLQLNQLVQKNTSSPSVIRTTGAPTSSNTGSQQVMLSLLKRDIGPCHQPSTNRSTACCRAC